MKKRLCLLFVLLLACVCLTLTLTACGEGEHIHTPNSTVRENEVSATCTAVGSYDEVVYCSECNEEISRTTKTTEMLSHTLSDWITDTEATCKVEGEKHKECTVCHTELETSKIDKLTTHTPKNAVKENEVDAKCNVAGSYDEVVYCSVCDTELSREEKEIAKLPHTEATDIAKAPSYTETGLTEGKHCSVCNEVLVAQKIVKANGHTDDNNDYACDICKVNLCTEHKEEIIPAVSATCTESGLTEGKKCSICGDILVAQETVKANGHRYIVENTDSKYLDKAADCENAATYFYSCACGAKGTTTFTHGSENGHTDKNNDYTCDICTAELCTEHVEEIIPAVSATCTETGSTEGKKCSICSKVLIEQEVIEPTGHNYDQKNTDVEYKKSDATTESPALYYYSCICGEKGTESFEYGEALPKIEVEYIELDPVAITIEVGDSARLEAIVYPQNATDKTVDFISSNTAVAIIRNGNIIGVSEGSTTIIAMTENGKTATCLVNVSAKTYLPEKIEMNIIDADLNVGDSITLTATITPDYATDKTILWSSSDPSVATVTGGVIYGISDGTAIITATTSNGKVATVNVTVKSIPVTSLAFTEPQYYVDAGKSYSFLDKIIITPANATAKTLAWSSSDESIITIDNNGKIICLRDGTVTITATTLDGTVNTSCTITVENSCGLIFQTYDSGYAVSGCNIITSKIVVPKTYRGKPVTALLSTAFFHTRQTLAELIIGDNVTYIADGTLGDLGNLKTLIIPPSFDLASLFYRATINYETLDYERFDPITKKTIFIINADFGVPADNTDWELSESSKIPLSDGSGIFIWNGAIIPHSDVITFNSQNFLGSGYMIKYPKKVKLHGYIVPNGLKIIQTSNPFSTSLDKTCLEGALDITLKVGGVKVGNLSDYLSSNDRAKLKTVGTHTVTVNYFGYIQNFDITIIPCGGSAKQENTIASTCTTDGSYDTVIYCEICHNEISRKTFVIFAKGHDYIDHESKLACTNIGWNAYRTCSRCDYSTYEELPALGHDYIDNEAKEPTCTEVGWNAYRTCSRCDYSTYEELPALGHGYVDNEAKEPTCTEVGWNAYRTCSHCDYSTYSEISALGHSSQSTIENFIGDDCTQVCDYSLVTYCDRCDNELSRESKSEAQEKHQMIDGKCSLCNLPSSSEGLKCTLNEDKKSYTVSGFTGNYSQTPLVIGVYNGLSVTTINSFAFHKNNLLEEVIIGGCVKEIEAYAFSGCTKLKRVTLGNNVTHIGSYAFHSCINITSITLPQNVTSIDDYAFTNCYRLVEIINKSPLDLSVGTSDFGAIASNALIMHKDSSLIKEVGEFCFISVNGANYLIRYDGDDSHIILPSKYNEDNYCIYSYAFYYCDNVTSITIPDCVTTIGKYAFQYCSNLTTATISDNVSNIGTGAFSHCSSLTDVNIPLGIDYIPSYMFEQCTSLVYLTIPNGITGIGSNVFAHCEMLESITIPDSVTYLGNAFSYCKNLKTVNIPVYITNISAGTFSHCTSLTSIIIPKSVHTINYYAFEGCENLTNVIFENPDKWKVGATSLLSTDLSNSKIAATYLVNDYCGYLWHRSTS